MLIPLFKSTIQYTQYTPAIYYTLSLSLTLTMCRNSLLCHLRGHGRRTVTLYPNGDRIHDPGCSCISVTTPMANSQIQTRTVIKSAMCHNINSFFVVPTCHCQCITTVVAHSSSIPVETEFMVPAVPVTVKFCAPVHAPVVCIPVLS